MNFQLYKYCNSLTQFSRLKTHVVNIGNVPLGGDYPIRIQSMTNTETLNTEATVNQSIDIINAGSEYVRFTACGTKDAENLINIKNDLLAKGYNTPLIADVHFNPKAADIAAMALEKVRINPGNYIDKRATFVQLEYTDEEYKQELEKIRERFVPFLNLCKKHNTAIRIGTNHGSLSDRIMSRYGDTPNGMVEATMEFLRICVDEDFSDVVISLKSSNTRVMVQACRLLINQMLKENMDFPLHLGVTEAGEGEDGRIKSAVGTGALLADGIGDTIRVSLTEPSENEIVVAKKLLNYFNNRENHKTIKSVSKSDVNPFEYNKRETTEINNIGGENVPVVIADLSHKIKISTESIEKLGFAFDSKKNIWHTTNFSAEYIYTGNNDIQISLPDNLAVICDSKIWKKSSNTYPLFTIEEYIKANEKSEKLNFVKIDYPNLDKEIIELAKNDNSLVFVLTTNNLNGLAEQRAFFYELKNQGIETPVIINRFYSDNNIEDLQIKSACDTGLLFIDGFGDGIWLTNNNIDCKNVNETAFNILQASRVRTSKTEYISCPSCGRTQYNIQEAVAIIRKRTSHLKGLKIGIMGCIVNGPGEMADVDYGYVGSGKDKITLYKGKQLIKKNIPTKNAVNELIALIKENGDWVEE
ncbi:MAG: (E)-4-hydroxy-3-methylbut-2-enyl-diphosphate synthase [Bacteroidetes bacterium]|nr:(E)-4-hydroxy-3-methylbut-2-enyl-diphosphate synthase [Bacteroidota bacterium]